MSNPISPSITDLGKFLKVETNSAGNTYVMIPKCGIINIGRAGDYGYINLNQGQAEKLSYNQVRVDINTVINGSSRADMDLIMEALASISECPTSSSQPLSYPIVSLSLNDTDTYQMGNPDTTLNVHYTVTKGGYPIESVVLDGIDITQGPGDIADDVDVTLIDDTDKTYVLYAEDTAGQKAYASVQVYWKYAVHWGVSDYDHDEFTSFVDGTDVEDLLFDKELSDGNSFDGNFDCTRSKYIHVLYPEEYGTDVDVTMGSVEISAFTASLVSIDDIYGVTRNYYVLSIDTIQTSDDINVTIVWN